jgi:hypothetical protein
MEGFVWTLQRDSVNPLNSTRLRLHHPVPARIGPAFAEGASCRIRFKIEFFGGAIALK